MSRAPLERLRACLLVALAIALGACAGEDDEEVAASTAAIAPPSKLTVADYAGVIRKADGRVDVPTMIDRLRALHVNTYAFLLWGWRYQKPASEFYTTDFDDLRLFTIAAEEAGIRVSAYIASPTEMKMYAPPPCRADYACWGDKIGAVAAEHPNLDTIVVDDFFARSPVGGPPTKTSSFTA